MAGDGDRGRKRRAANERARLRLQLERQTTRENGRKLRPAQNAGAVRETVLPTGTLRAHSPATWVPEAGCVVSTIESVDGRSVIGVAAEVVPAMLALLVPRLVSTAGLTLSERGGTNGPRRGASVILTMAWSSSDPHRDEEDTLLANISCDRTAWYAAPTAADGVLSRSREGGSTFLPLETAIQPATHSRCAPRMAWCGQSRWSCRRATPSLSRGGGGIALHPRQVGLLYPLRS
jgi:hypothetical protein